MSGIGRVGTGGVGPVDQPDVEAPAAPASTPTSAPAGRTPSSGTTATGRAADVWARLATVSQPTAAPATVDASRSRGAVMLGTSGRFSRFGGPEPTTPAAIGDALFGAACLIDDTKQNLFDGMRATPESRRLLLATLKQDLDSVRPGRTPPPGLSDLQALQMRSSGTTVLLELMTAKDTPDALKREAFATYRDLLRAETNPMLKDGMALHLDRLKANLPRDVQNQLGEVKEIVAPSKPPYDSWFKNGNDKVSVDWSAGSESLQDDITNLKKAGFKVTSQSYDKTTLEKTYTVNGKKTTFNVNLRPFSSDMFKNMADPKANMVIYTGHSNWGNNVRSSLTGAPATDGKDKLVLTDLCVGKGEMQQFRDKFPDSHLVTTFTSSYFIESGDGAEPESEGIHAILNTFQGIAARQGYEKIAEDVRRDNPWGSDHAAEGIDNNFIFPTDIATRRRVLDADHDGQADVFDRLIDFNTFDVKEDTAREFQAVDPSRPAKDLVGTKVHFAAMTVNRLTIYSEVFGKVNSTSKVVPGGYFEPGPTDKNLFRFTKTKDASGKDTVLMQMSSKYAHMSEEALRMAACFEYNKFMAAGNMPRWRLNQADTNISGMILASHSLDTDAGYRDSAVWSEFLKAYNLPDISRSDVEAVKEINHDWYSGSYQSITALNGKLTAEQKAGLGRPDAGRIK
jgi:hypothetical protein